MVSTKRNSQERIAVDFPAVDFPAVIEPSYLSIYAEMCQALSTKEVASASNPAETTNFRKLLLTLVQKEFENDSTGLVDVENKKKEIESAETVITTKLLSHRYSI
jgi:translation initiation factor 4G